MSEYFSNFPRIQYDINGINSTNPEFSTAVNLLIRQKIRDAVVDDISIYYPYVIPDFITRPDILSYEVYGDVKFTWSIFLVNQIFDPYWEWPLSYKDFRGYVVTKYGSIEKAQTTVHQYLKQARARVESTGTSDPIPVYNLEVDYETYSSTNIEERSIVYKYEYEQDLNEARREIQLIDVNYIASVQDEIRRLFR